MENKNYTQPNQEYEATPEAKPEKTKISGLRKIVYGTTIAGAIVAAAAGLYAAKEYNDYCKGMDELQGYEQMFQDIARETVEGIVQDIKEDPNK